MFGDLFGVSSSQVNEANQAHAVNYLAIAMVLVEKGLITEAELMKAMARATHLVEQEFARTREEAEKEFDSENPGVREMFKKVCGTFDAGAANE